jgi:myo-inositol 2-dehydrogenase / D-chiro-inositol 1-dehydrogenase
MIDRMTSVGMIGLGWIGEAHLTDLAARPDVRIAAVCDLDEGLVADRAGRFGAAGHTDPATMLAEHELDALWVCTPPQHHLAGVRLAAGHGVPVYLEKPVARDLADATAIAELVERTGLVCAVGYQWHALELLPRVRAELAAQQVVYLLGRSIGPTTARPWFLNQAQGGGNVLERGSHQIDLIRAVAGEVESVTAVAGSVRLDRDSAAAKDIDDALTLVLHLASGAIATIAVAWTPDEVPGSYSLEVIGSGGALKLALDPMFRLTGAGPAGTLDVTAATVPFTASNSRFLAAAAAGDPAAVAVTPADALATLKVALAAEEALATGTRIMVR